MHWAISLHIQTFHNYLDLYAMPTTKKVLLIAFHFPPNEGIGARRWAKLAKGLAKNNIQVHVLKATPLDGNQVSPWVTDVKHPLIHATNVKRRFSEIITRGPRSFVEKIKYRIHLAYYRMTAEGTPYDNAIDWEKDLLAKAAEIIHTEGITTVIATGAPFNVLLYGARLKKQMPELFYLADLRDPWLRAVNNGMPSLPPSKFRAEHQKITEVALQADLITAPYHELIDQVAQDTGVMNPHKYAVLPHFYDPDDIPDLKATPKGIGDHAPINIVYGGALYQGTEPLFTLLIDSLDVLVDKDPKTYRRLNVLFHTPDTDKIKIAPRHADVLRITPPIGKKLFTKVAQSDAVIVLLSEHNRNFKTTKFFEYLPFRKPILYLGPQGEVRQFITENQLGASPQSAQELAQFFIQLAHQQFVYNTEYDIQQHSLSQVTQQLIGLIEQN